MTKQQIITEIRSMPLEERAELIEELRQIVDDDDLTPEQLAELRRRVDAIDRGEEELLDGEQVMRELLQRFKQR